LGVVRKIEWGAFLELLGGYHILRASLAHLARLNSFHLYIETTQLSSLFCAFCLLFILSTMEPSKPPQRRTKRGSRGGRTNQKKKFAASVVSDVLDLSSVSSLGFNTPSPLRPHGCIGEFGEFGSTPSLRPHGCTGEDIQQSIDTAHSNAQEASRTAMYHNALAEANKKFIQSLTDAMAAGPAPTTSLLLAPPPPPPFACQAPCLPTTPPFAPILSSTTIIAPPAPPLFKPPLIDPILLPSSIFVDAYPPPPSQHVFSKREMVLFFKGNPQYLADSIFNVALVIEECADGALTSNGPLDFQRLVQHCTNLHIVLSSPYQVYIAKRLNVPHYQSPISAITTVLEDIDNYSSSSSRPSSLTLLPTVTCYFPTVDTYTDFVVVLNQGSTINKYLGDGTHINFQKLQSFLNEVKKKEVTTVRQASFVDFGFASGQNTSRTSTTVMSGVAEPRLKILTAANNDKVVPLFLAGSKLATKVKVPWMGPSQAVCFNPDDVSRQERFAGKIHPQNVLEALRIHETRFASRLHCHIDQHNPTEALYCGVIGITQVLENADEELSRVGVVFYQRKSISECLEREAGRAPLLSHLLEFIHDMPPEEQEIGTHLFSSSLDAARPLHQFSFASMLRNPCNLDPASFHQPFHVMTVALVQKFKLNLVEIASVATAYELIPETAYYWHLATSTMLGLKQLPSVFRGYGFGYLFAALALHFLQKYREGTHVQEVRRHSTYKISVLPTRLAFHDKVHCRLVLCLQVWRKSPTSKRKKTARTDYDTLTKIWQEWKDDGVGMLIAQHSMAMHSELGLLPPWVREGASITAGKLYMKYFMQKFPMIGLGRLGKPNVDSVVGDLQSALTLQLGGNFSRSWVENLLCKGYRASTESTSPFVDLLIDHQPLFKFESATVSVIHNDNSVLKVKGGSALINSFPFGESLLPTKDIAEKMKELTGNIFEQLSSVELPREIIETVVSVEFEFEVSSIQFLFPTGQLFSNVYNQVAENLLNIHCKERRTRSWQ
jgi:hypothetical protein